MLWVSHYARRCVKARHSQSVDSEKGDDDTVVAREVPGIIGDSLNMDEGGGRNSQQPDRGSRNGSR